MANTIRIKRRAVGGASGAPLSLANAELAFNEQDNILYYGKGSGGTEGSATTIETIGGLGAFTSLGTTQTITGDKTFTGSVLVPTLGTSISTTGAASTAYVKSVLPTVSSSTGITIATSGTVPNSVISITNTAVTAGSYGSTTAIPVFTVNAQGQLTAASTAAIASNLNIAGDSGTDAIALLTETLTFAGGTGITSTVSANAVDFSIDSTVATLTGTQTLTNKTLTGTASVGLRDTSAAFDVTIGATSSTVLTAGRALTLDVVNAARTIKLGGNLTLAGDLTTAGAFATTLTTTAATSVTLPITGTLATLANSETFTNKTMSTGSIWNGTTVAVAYGGTGTVNGSITGTGALTYTAGGTNTNINLVPNGTGVVDVASKRVTNVATPTDDTDAANKLYVDAMSQGLTVKDAVRVATTANITLSAPQTVDGVALVAGNRVLVKNQTVGAENGLYLVAAAAWTRTVDADAPNEIGGGDFVFVQEGADQADSGWVCTNDGAVTIGTTALTFVQFSGAGQVIAGAGLTKAGNTLDVIGTTNRILVNADSIDIASTYVGQASITTLGTVGTGTWQGTVVGSTYGGTGVNNGSNTITLAGNVTHAGAFTQSFTATAATALTLPTTGTLATLAGTEAFSNKTINSSSIGATTRSTGAFTTLASNDTTTFSLSTDATSTSAAAVILSGGIAVAKTMYIGANIVGAGPGTAAVPISTIDGFQLDGGTY